MTVVRVKGEDMIAVKDASSELKAYFESLSRSKGRDITYTVRTYGCQLNESDSEKLEGMLISFGLKKCEDSIPDLVILNTCSVRENAEDRLFGNLGEFKAAMREDGDRLLIVCGCMMKVKENVDRIKKSFPYVDLVFDPQNLHRFPVLLLQKIKRHKQLTDISIDDYIADDTLLDIRRQRKFRALVPIMYGCNNFCTYCIVPYTRGRERSRDYELIMKDLKDLSEAGYKEIMLLGQNVNSYTAYDKPYFPQLLRDAAEKFDFKRIRFMSSHPKDISDEVIDIMASHDNIEKHLHLPLQSGSDRILKAMNRPYTKEKFLKTAMRFREMIPDGSLSTDIIVGFPGETEEDFLETLDVVKKVGFDSAFTFQYSPRPGTVAAKMEGRLSPEVMRDRFSRLLEIQNDLAYRSNQAKVGKTEDVLIEGESSGDSNVLTGRTSSFHLINFTIPDELKIEGYSSNDYEGMMCRVRFTEARPYSVDGIMESFI